MSDILVANTSFSCEINGVPQIITAKRTRVRKGHPIALRNPEYFDEVEERVDFDVETATKKPGEKRGTPKTKE